MQDTTFIYNDYGTWIRKQFDFRVQKLSLDAGFTCPNRNGLISTGGCTFCDNQTFNPQYTDRKKTIKEQLLAGKMFFREKYPEMKYLAYFQSYTNTFASIEHLKKIYEEALSDKDVVGIVVGTRPDCVDDSILDYFENLHKQTFVVLEYGVESTKDSTLARVNRGHDFNTSRRAIENTAKRGLICAAHVIIGLPGEDRNDIINQAKIISELPINILKLHQLQIIKGTKLAYEYLQQEKNNLVKDIHPMAVDEYIEILSEYIKYVRKDIVLERFVSQSPKSLCLAPSWGLKNHEFTDKFVKYLKQHNISQGCKIVESRNMSSMDNS